MIHDFDRSGYFGASDMRYVLLMNRDTKTWKQWWSVKLGTAENEFKGNKYTEAGTAYEHPILNSISDQINLDRQLIYERLLLRVNYDGDLNGTIYEVKTHRADKLFEVTKPYWLQAQAQMYCYQVMQEEMGLPEFKKLWIVSYPLLPEDYNNVIVDPDRICFTPIEYDKGYVKHQMIPALKRLSRKLRKEIEREKRQERLCPDDNELP